VRLLLLFLLTAVLLFGQVFKLFLKDGDYHLVREYHVEGDRVRYYSTERSQWEEIPTALVDLAKTEHVRAAKLQSEQRMSKEFDAEEQAERELQHEIGSIPQDTGSYYRIAGQVKTLPAADYKVITDKRRAILKTISPIPIVPGKAAVVIQGEHSKFIIHESRPQFYVRPAKQDQFGIAKLTPRKNTRIVESVSIVPVENADIENRKEDAIFTQQLAGNLFKIWPEKPLTPGEYAVVEYNGDSYDPNGEVDLIIWDFAYQPQ
jgi:hypothetical protein